MDNANSHYKLKDFAVPFEKKAEEIEYFKSTDLIII